MNLTIYVPDELGKRVRKAKDLAVSPVCQRALERALDESEEGQVLAMLIVCNPEGSRMPFDGLGERRFFHLPRIGEHVELNVGEKNPQGHLFRVVAVCHGEPVLSKERLVGGPGVDVYVVDEGRSVEVLRTFRSADRRNEKKAAR